MFLFPTKWVSVAYSYLIELFLNVYSLSFYGTLILLQTAFSQRCNKKKHAHRRAALPVLQSCGVGHLHSQPRCQMLCWGVQGEHPAKDSEHIFLLNCWQNVLLPSSWEMFFCIVLLLSINPLTPLDPIDYSYNKFMRR